MAYTPFDLPKEVKQGASTITFGYDGDKQRIRKSTPDEETLYFGDLYERVTQVAPATTEHRYRIHSSERPLLLESENKLGRSGHLMVWVFGELRTPRETNDTAAAARAGQVGGMV